MNQPAIPTRSSRRAALRFVLFMACGISLVLWLLHTPEENGGREPAAAAKAVRPEAAPPEVNGTAPPERPAPAAPGGAPVPSPLPALPAVATVKDLNSLADGPWPVADKVAALTEIMRRPGGGDLPQQAAQRLVWLVKDGDYQALMAPLALDASMPAPVLDAIALNIHSRRLEVVQPLLERLAATPGHPLATEAAETLEFHRRAGNP